MSDLEFTDIQGIVFSTYGHLKSANYYFLQIQDSQKAKIWLSGITMRVMNAAPWPKNGDGTIQKPLTALNIAFSAPGLKMLGQSLNGFSTEFVQGMGSSPENEYACEVETRALRLGDTGPNNSANWEIGGPHNPPVHLLLMLFAESAETVAAFFAQVLPDPLAAGLLLLYTQDSYRPAEGREPFGFNDGMSQPIIEGSVHGRKVNNPDTLLSKAGEFLLGYENEYKLLPPMPDTPGLGQNGTYIVYRKLEQDVPGFWNFIYENAQKDRAMAEWLAAKFVGRWPSGAPLVLSPAKDNPLLGTDPDKNNDFKFVDTDIAGTACPIGSHVRRVNPRDSLQPTPEDSLKAVQKHRLIRRGRIYGPEYSPDVLDQLIKGAAAGNSSRFVADTTEPRGLSLIMINADIKRQFEFVQQTWVNDPKFAGLYDNPDPLLGGSDPDNGVISTMTIQRKPVRRQISGLPRFVTVKGGGYFFLPGLKALNLIAAK